MTLDHLWAGWRASYIENVANQPPSADGCLFCRLLAADPEEALVIARNDQVFAVMNAYPYTSGHLMVAPLRHEGTLSGLSTEEANALMAMTQDATVAVDRRVPPRGRQCRCEHRPRRGRRNPWSRARARRPEVERRHQLHDLDRRRARAAGTLADELGQAAGKLATGSPIASPPWTGRESSGASHSSQSTRRSTETASSASR